MQIRKEIDKYAERNYEYLKIILNRDDLKNLLMNKYIMEPDEIGNEIWLILEGDKQ